MYGVELSALASVYLLFKSAGIYMALLYIEKQIPTAPANNVSGALCQVYLALPMRSQRRNNPLNLMNKLRMGNNRADDVVYFIN